MYGYIHKRINKNIKILLSTRKVNFGTKDDPKYMYKLIGIDYDHNCYVVEAEDKKVAMKLLTDRIIEKDNPYKLNAKVEESKKIIGTVKADKKNYNDGVKMVINKKNTEFDNLVKDIKKVIGIWEYLKKECKKLK